MRKITNESIEAFLSKQNYKKSNMQVKVSENETFLCLWENPIAFIDRHNELFINTCGYKTRTTVERLNGLPNVNIKLKRGDLMLNGKEWNGKLTKIS